MNASGDNIRFVSTVSEERDLHDALDVVLGPAEAQLGVGSVDLVLAFATGHHRHGFGALAERIRVRLAPRMALGVTVAGVLGGGREVEDGPALALLAGRLEGIDLHPFSYEQLNWTGDGADPAPLRRALTGSDAEQLPAAILLLADPFSTPLVKLIPALNRALPGVPVIGGMASGASEAGGNRLLLNDQVMCEGAVGVSLSGPLSVDCVVSQGCRPVGDPWVITRARHNLIQQLGRRPVLEAIEATAEEADPEDRRLMEAHGLLIGRVIDEYRERFGRGDFLVRNIIGADSSSGYIAVSDLVRVGQTVQFHVRDRQTAEEDLRLLLRRQARRGAVAGALLCTCNGRGQRLFGRRDAESHLIRRVLGPVPLAGFFAAGEIGPIGGNNFVHGFTSALALFRETGPDGSGPSSAPSADRE